MCESESSDRFPKATEGCLINIALVLIDLYSLGDRFNTPVVQTYALKRLRIVNVNKLYDTDLVLLVGRVYEVTKNQSDPLRKTINDLLLPRYLSNAAFRSALQPLIDETPDVLVGIHQCLIADICTSEGSPEVEDRGSNERAKRTRID